nr:type II toxin-antitoxin system RelE/ParE family toxin [Desulfobulbaceae bacterium]
MKYNLSFLPEVEEDVIAGYLWYEERAFSLGEEFVRMFYVRVREFLSEPLLYQEIYGGFRRCLLRRFPYAIYFRVDGIDVVVFGLFHCARDPHTIKGQLLTRDM